MQRSVSTLLTLFLLAASAACSVPPTPILQPSSTPTSGPVFGGGLAGETITSRDWDRAVAYATGATALVRSIGCDFRATGTAVAVSADELVTNRHVVQDAQQLTIETDSGETATVAEWFVSSVDDLALLRVRQDLFTRPTTLATDPVVPGDLMVVMGFPLGGPFTVGRGRVTDVRSTGPGSPQIRASVEVLPGNSGGPLLDTHGRLVGVIRAIDLNRGEAIAVPADRVANLIARQAVSPGRPCRD